LGIGKGTNETLDAALRRHLLRHTTLEPPDQSTGEHEQNRDQLGSGHQAAEDFTASGIVAQKFNEITLDSVEDHERPPNLSIKFLALEEPHEQNKIEKLGGSFDQLRWFNSHAERCSTDRIRQWICEDNAPRMIRGFSVTAARGKTTKTAEHMAKRQPRSETIRSAQHRHVVTPHIPHRCEQSGNQSAGKYAPCLQRVEAENLASIAGVSAPVIDDVQNLGADNSGEHNENAKIPGVIAIDALLLRIAHADPKSDQHAGSDQHAISRQVETAYLKKSWEHVSLDAPDVRCALKRV